MEIWKDIPNSNGDYQASTFGKIRNKKGLILKIKMNKLRSNYNYVILYGKSLLINNKSNKKGLSLHRLIAITFISNPNNKPEVNHIDGNKSNNNITNLEWVTRKENTIHMYKTGLSGKKTHKSKLSNENVIEIKQLLLKGISNKNIAIKFNVNESTISLIKTGKRKKYVTL